MSDNKKMTGGQEEALAAEETKVTQGEENEEAVDLHIKFRKPYRFEGKDYNGVDLTGLEDATANDLIAVERILRKRGVMDPLVEMSPELAALLASRVARLPEEFFMGLPINEMVKLKTTISGFLYGGAGDN